MESAPAWLGAAGERASKQAKKSDPGSASSAARAAIRGKGGRDALLALVMVLTKLVLSNSKDIRELIGAVYHTWICPEEDSLIQVLLAAGAAYNEDVQNSRARAKEAWERGEEVHPVDLGPPHVKAWARWVEAAAKEAKDEESRRVLIEYWNGVVVQAPSPPALEAECRLFKVKKIQHGKHGGKVKFQAAIAHNALDKALTVLAKERKYERCVGAPPRGNLEREAQTLLDKLGKQ